MTNPHIDELDGWRTSVEAANFVDAEVRARNIDAGRQNIVAFIEDGSPAINSLAKASGASRAYLSSISMFSTGDEDLKRSALAAIDVAAEALKDAKPSSYARALGLDW